MSLKIDSDGPYIVGLAHEYPSYSFSPDDFDGIVKKLYPDYASNIGLQKLLGFNHKTQIDSRRSIFDLTQWTEKDVEPPTINQLSRIFRKDGVELTSKACANALKESYLLPGDITHTVAVTCTDQGNPGYDLFVCEKLGLGPNVQRVLLHGVGCAGGLSALRTAADIAVSETQRGRPARILVMACELCSLFLRAELRSAAQDDSLHIAPALFSDAAAAVVVCNNLALRQHQEPIFELNEWGSMLIPNTLNHMSYEIDANGMLATLAKDVPNAVLSAIGPMYHKLQKSSKRTTAQKENSQPKPSDFDWAIHPGGAAILLGAQQAMQLSNDHIRASLGVYKSCGNSSSPTILIVLDKLRRMGRGRDQMIATSFGPGMIIEMFRIRRYREIAQVAPPLPQAKKRNILWSWLRLRIKRFREQQDEVHRLHRVDSGIGSAPAS